ncbi:MAG: MFS transporter, partial [Myxococcales bacterium]|nr:MFS transporter [Myxococcales bacterium]
MSQFALLREKRFGALFWTQFWGAFNDNLFKNALVVMVTFETVAGEARSAQEVALLANVSAGLFILPFFLFSATAGQIADKLSKSQQTRGNKLMEIGIMLTAALGFYLDDTRMLMGVLLLMGTQSALFGPVKYSILPQHLREEELVGGNGLIEMGTFVAIVIGTLAGTQLPGEVVALAIVGIATVGYMHSRSIPQAVSDPTLKIRWNVFTETVRTIGFARRERAVFLSILGISWFWFYGALFLAQFPSLSTEELHGNREVVGLLLVCFSVGIGLGSLLCERLSGRKVELGLVPFGSIGLSLFGFDLYFALQAHPTPAEAMGAIEFLQSGARLRILADLVVLGMFGGFYIVPLYAIVQQRSAPAYRSRIIAGNNILNALFMVIAALLAVALRGAGLSVPELFLVTAALNVLVAVYIYTLLPEFLMRFLIWILVHTV